MRADCRMIRKKPVRIEMASRKNVTYSARPTHAARSAHAKGDKLFRTYDTSAIRPKRSPVPAIVGIIVLIVALVLIIFGVFTAFKGCSSGNLVAEGTEVTVVVNEGEGANSIADKLVEAGLIRRASEFTDELARQGASDSLHPGSFTLVGGMSVDELIKVLQTPVQAVMFTVPEGSTIQQTAQIVADATDGKVTVDQFVAAASDASAYAASYSFLEGVGTNSLEGFLFPKSYPVDSSSTADSLIRAMLDQFGTETASLNFANSPAAQQGYSFYDMVKLASIIERETDENYRERVASVFYNRMAIGMPLDSDATMAYIVGREPTPDELDQEHPYNTYSYVGLPPTPIDSPSLGCMQAACNPEQSTYYYFFIGPDDNGEMKYAFSETYDEHVASYS